MIDQLNEYYSMNITSYNCNSLKNKVDTVRGLLDRSDILLLQEIFILDDETDFVSAVDSDFDVIVSPSQLPPHSTSGRPLGGMVLFHRRSLDLTVETLATHDHYVIYKLSGSFDDFYLVNVYLPCNKQDIDSLLFYQYVLGELQSAIDDNCNNRVIFIGDFNADPNFSRFWPYLQDFINFNFLIMNDLVLSSDIFTYLSPAHNTTSWIDHIISSHVMLLDNISVLHDFALYDHFPISVCLKLKSVPAEHESNSPHSGNEFSSSIVDWSQFDDGVRSEYNDCVSRTLLSYGICTEVLCNIDHRSDIDSYYRTLLSSMLKFTNEFMNVKSRKFKPVPGWNEYCKLKYTAARDAFVMWKDSGKLRTGILFDNMLLTRKQFKCSLKYCRDNEQNIRDKKLASAMTSNNMYEFWKEVKRRRNKTNVHVNSVDGLKSDENISRMFERKFSNVTACDRRVDMFSHPHLNASNIMEFNLCDVKEAIGRLKVGIGFDCIHSNHLKFGNDSIIGAIVKLFNSFVIHNHIPEAMLEGVVIPNVKNKFGNCKDSSNYREIMISSNFLKLFEYCLLSRLNSHVSISPFQFGYRKNTSTILSTSLFKEVVGKYLSENSVVYACFLDLSKAFERVDHTILLDKLREAQVPGYILNMYRCILRNSHASVKYGDAFSDRWRIGRGVRQGGISSAFLFSLYIDSILKDVAAKPYSCYLGIAKFNVLSYADDILIFSPSSSGLQILIDTVCANVRSHRLEINVKKTKILIFRNTKQYRNVNFNYNGVLLDVVNSYNYLGSILKFNLHEDLDIERIIKSFNKSSGMFFRKFYSCDFNVKLKLFNTLCTSFYGSELWLSTVGAVGLFKQLTVSYHTALKKILGIPKYFSNHCAALFLNVLLLDHLLNYKQIRFYKWLGECSSSCFIRFKFYFMNFSTFKSHIDDVWKTKYNVEDVLDNDLDALMSRLYFVQHREPSSYFLGF